MNIIFILLLLLNIKNVQSNINIVSSTNSYEIENNNIVMKKRYNFECIRNKDSEFNNKRSFANDNITEINEDDQLIYIECPIPKIEYEYELLGYIPEKVYIQNLQYIQSFNSKTNLDFEIEKIENITKYQKILKPINEPCTEDSECASNICIDSRCVLPISETGKCLINNHCENGLFCHPVYYNCTVEIESGSNDYCFKNYYCNSNYCKNGKCLECSIDTDCDVNESCFAGICKLKDLKYNEECTENEQCLSNICNNGKCGCSYNIECGDDQFCNSIDKMCTSKYINNYPDKNCISNDQCLSGICYQEKCKECIENFHCESNICDNDGICSNRRRLETDTSGFEEVQQKINEIKSRLADLKKFKPGCTKYNNWDYIELNIPNDWKLDEIWKKHNLKSMASEIYKKTSVYYRGCWKDYEGTIPPYDGCHFLSEVGIYDDIDKYLPTVLNNLFFEYNTEKDTAKINFFYLPQENEVKDWFNNLLGTKLGHDAEHYIFKKNLNMNCNIIHDQDCFDSSIDNIKNRITGTGEYKQRNLDILLNAFIEDYIDCIINKDSNLQHELLTIMVEAQQTQNEAQFKFIESIDEHLTNLTQNTLKINDNLNLLNESFAEFMELSKNSDEKLQVQIDATKDELDALNQKLSSVEDNLKKSINIAMKIIDINKRENERQHGILKEYIEKSIDENLRENLYSLLDNIKSVKLYMNDVEAFMNLHFNSLNSYMSLFLAEDFNLASQISEIRDYSNLINYASKHVHKIVEGYSTEYEDVYNFMTDYGNEPLKNEYGNIKNIPFMIQRLNSKDSKFFLIFNCDGIYLNYITKMRLKFLSFIQDFDNGKCSINMIRKEYGDQLVISINDLLVSSSLNNFEPNISEFKFETFYEYMKWMVETLENHITTRLYQMEIIDLGTSYDLNHYDIQLDYSGNGFLLKDEILNAYYASVMSHKFIKGNNVLKNLFYYPNIESINKLYDSIKSKLFKLSSDFYFGTLGSDIDSKVKLGSTDEFGNVQQILDVSLLFSSKKYLPLYKLHSPTIKYDEKIPTLEFDDDDLISRIKFEEIDSQNSFINAISTIPDVMYKIGKLDSPFTNTYNVPFTMISENPNPLGREATVNYIMISELFKSEIDEKNEDYDVSKWYSDNLLSSLPNININSEDIKLDNSFEFNTKAQVNLDNYKINLVEDNSKCPDGYNNGICNVLKHFKYNNYKFNNKLTFEPYEFTTIFSINVDNDLKYNLDVSNCVNYEVHKSGFTVINPYSSDLIYNYKVNETEHNSNTISAFNKQTINICNHKEDIPKTITLKGLHENCNEYKFEIKCEKKIGNVTELYDIGDIVLDKELFTDFVRETSNFDYSQIDTQEIINSPELNSKFEDIENKLIGNSSVIDDLKYNYSKIQDDMDKAQTEYEIEIENIRQLLKGNLTELNEIEDVLVKSIGEKQTDFNKNAKEIEDGLTASYETYRTEFNTIKVNLNKDLADKLKEYDEKLESRGSDFGSGWDSGNSNENNQIIEFVSNNALTVAVDSLVLVIILLILIIVLFNKLSNEDVKIKALLKYHHEKFKDDIEEWYGNHEYQHLIDEIKDDDKEDAKPEETQGLINRGYDP